MREKYETLSLTVLKELAKARGMRGISTLKKGELIDAMVAQDALEQQNAPKTEADLNQKPEQENRFMAEATAPQESAEYKEVRTENESTQNRVNAQENGNVQNRMNAQENGSAQNRMNVQENGSAQNRVNAQENGNVQNRMNAQENGSAQNRVNAQENGSVQNRMNAQTDGNKPVGSEQRRTRTTYSREYGNNQRQTYVKENGGPRFRSVRENGVMRRDASDSRTEYGTARRERSEVTDNRQEYGTARRERSEVTENRQEYGTARRERPEVTENRQEYSTARRERPEVTENRQEYGTAQAESVEVNQENRAENNEARTENADRPPVELSQLDSGITVSGILEVMTDGYGFIRSDNYMPGENDVYVSPSQIRRFGLKTGDIIGGNTRIKSQQEKFSALLYLKTINGKSPAESARRRNFEDMTPIFPNERLRMERGSKAVAMRIVDLFSPIGKGQRGMIVSPPKAGKTTLLKDVAHSILQNDPKMRLLILLIDERPEEVTDIKEAICGENVEVIYSTFDELPEHHKRVSEMVIERAKRLVEQHENVTILLDSITRLARAYNLTVPPSGRTLSGGLDPAALHMPKRFFGAARNMREGGSLTILATALVDTGSKMDDVVYEEFKGTGNMELVLDRRLSEKRVFPAIDIPKSGTRREDLLLDREEKEAVDIMRRALNGMKSDDAVENILNMFVHTQDNRELVAKVRKQKFI